MHTQIHIYTSAPIGIRTQVLRFKVSSDNHYTIGAGSIFNPYTRGNCTEWGSNPRAVKHQVLSLAP